LEVKAFSEKKTVNLYKLAVCEMD